MAKSVEVTLVITVSVDEQYSGADHATDIVSTAVKTFPAADVRILAISIASDRDLVEARPPRIDG
ncbi:MAG: hypothetical protein WBA15_15950 [Mesorhizobium sp.]